MMSEYAENLGRRVELRQKRLQIVAQCEALRDQNRRILNPVDDVSCIDRDAYLSSSVALHQSLEELAALDRQLAKIDSILGK
jgi:hypothetical protein